MKLQHAEVKTAQATSSGDTSSLVSDVINTEIEKNISQPGFLPLQSQEVPKASETNLTQC